MRGFVMLNCFERQAPYVHARVTGKYNAQQHFVEVVATVEGDDYDGDNLWYRLSTGGYVWSGAINIATDGSALPDIERKQYIISFRESNKDSGTPLLSSKTPSCKLTFGPITLPADPDKVFVRDYSPQDFANQVVQLLEPISPDRKHVFIYIHGYQFLSSLKLDLLTNFVQNYVTHENNKIAKVLFFTWPAQGPGRKTVDDRSVRAGQLFAQNGMFSYLKLLSETLSNEGRKLNLIVHSFGHQLLNGMLNPQDSTQLENYLKEKIFENVFLMAPDITHLAIQSGGVQLPNNFSDDETKEIFYDFSRLQSLAGRVHIFHNKYDYLLHVSTKKFLDKQMRKHPDKAVLPIIRQYRGLGNFGKSQLDTSQLKEGFHFWDVDELIKNYADVDLLNYPFRVLRNGLQRRIDKIWDKSDYSEIKFTDTLFNIGHTADHHRYLFTCKQVIDKVQSLL